MIKFLLILVNKEKFNLFYRNSQYLGEYLIICLINLILLKLNNLYLKISN